MSRPENATAPSVTVEKFKSTCLIYVLLYKFICCCVLLFKIHRLIVSFVSGICVADLSEAFF